MTKSRCARPVIYRAETDYHGAKLVLKYTNGKRSVLIVDGMDVRYAMFTNEVIKLVNELENHLQRV